MDGDGAIEMHRCEPMAELGVGTHQRQIAVPFAGSCGKGEDDPEATVVQAGDLIEIEQAVLSGMTIESPHHVPTQIGQRAEIDRAAQGDHGTLIDEIDTTLQLHGGER